GGIYKNRKRGDVLPMNTSWLMWIMWIGTMLNTISSVVAQLVDGYGIMNKKCILDRLPGRGGEPNNGHEG
ncbi:MAG: hypothetical protein MJE68_02800, partial [Proteobacteria bacterium]|nr:hypothetical protein [Pseudomonadota bacterium]